jgi:O-antigen ligase
MRVPAPSVPRAEPVGSLAWLDAAIGRLLDPLIVLWLLLATSSVIPLLFSDPNVTTISAQTRAMLRILNLPGLALAFVLLVLHFREVAAVLARHPTLPLLLLWVWCSVAWSLDPEVSGRRALSLTAYTIIACWLAATYRPDAVVRRMVLVLLGVLLLSLALAVALPGYAFMVGGQFRGAFTHKNGLGEHLVISALFFLLAWQFRLMPRILVGPGLLLVAGMTALAGSATTLIVLLLLLGVQPVLAVARLPPPQAAAWLLFLGSAGLFLALAAILSAQSLLALLGRDLTFTGRTDLWSHVWGMIQERPLLGYGYGAYFELPAVASYLLAALRWEIPNAHNGFLEAWLGLGTPGLVLVVSFLLGGLVRGWRLVRQAGPEDVPGRLAGHLALLYLAVYLARNLSEANLMSQTGLGWVLAVAAVLMTGRRPGPAPGAQRPVLGPRPAAAATR